MPIKFAVVEGAGPNKGRYAAVPLQGRGRPRKSREGEPRAWNRADLHMIGVLGCHVAGIYDNKNIAEQIARELTEKKFCSNGARP